MKRVFLPFTALLLALPAGPATSQHAHATISMATARAHALRIVPHGRIRSGELEREHGQLIYSFDIEVPHHSGIEEVQISAVTGRLVSRTHETPAAEHREAQAEAREPGHR